ncbi:hypothetical protein ASPVEDRAFT_41648 [Aspergillus versicolor CBS 583.65]|uniref:2EXR domain-containing protein n=1 Tax=Aspergillus versicolor CBS 583.65 TaxID=1036611 RepID=A0A1L9PKV7_ASPVE|nr:uncharacterized protein ASPVEDRAFT_41648 [Aspergillus versicolor CBS 583.65]OJJ02169.1 hypothetical protein ASPVEDRAFT_41648 [Aspergillus versicolor CBS 583.65]
MTETTQFHQFPYLPPELRTMIWKEALPKHDTPALYPWKTGYWQPRPLQKSDEAWGQHEDVHLFLEFRHDLFDHVQVDIPLFFVSQEARELALAWIQKQGIHIHTRSHIQGQRYFNHKQRDGNGNDNDNGYIFTRPFNSLTDALYIPVDKMADFYNDPIHRLTEPDLIGQKACVAPDTARIAFSADLFLYGDVSTISELLKWYTVLDVLFVVVDPQPCWEDADADASSDSGMQQVQGERWEVEGKEKRTGMTFLYSHKRKRFDLCGGGEVVGDEALYERIEEAAKYLTGIAAKKKNGRFEIRPVLAARRL